MAKPDVLIVGAGLAGLTAALALLRAGARVRVAEQAPALGEIGAGITLTPNATRVLAHLGLGEALDSLLDVPERQEIRHWESGAVLVSKMRGPGVKAQYGFPYGHIHRADLHQLLAEAVLTRDPAAILLNHKAAKARSFRKSARVWFETGESLSAAVVVGADGVRSVLREALFEPAPPRFTGHVAWRGVAPAADLPDRVNAAPPGLFIGPGKMVLRYPVRGWSAWNYAAFSRRASWPEQGWTTRADKAELMAEFDGWHPVVRDTLASTAEAQCFIWPLYARTPIPTWRAGRVVLIGDAAHAMLPFLGQGAALGLEDGLVLARALTECAEVDDGLAAFERARKARGDDTQREAAAIADRLQGEAAGDYGKAGVRDEESMGYFAYDAVSAPLAP